MTAALAPPPTSGLQPGEAFSVTFEAPGAYEYHCSLHPTMRGVVVVAAR